LPDGFFRREAPDIPVFFAAVGPFAFGGPMAFFGSFVFFTDFAAGGGSGVAPANEAILPAAVPMTFAALTNALSCGI
jgi:hypothetical protein